MKHRLTLRDIAEAGNVSEMTVSRALRGAHDVSIETRERINRIAFEMGYVPNKIAGALASKRVDLVGVIVPSVRSYIFSEVLDGISKALAETKLRPVFGMTDYDPAEETQVIKDMLSWRPSGLIVAGLEHSAEAKTILRATDVPVVEMMDIDGEPIHTAVGISNQKAAYNMGQTILAKGHKEIAFIGTKMDHDYRATKRLQGFKRALAEASTTLNSIKLYSEGSSVSKGREIAKQLLTENPKIDCIYCTNDLVALGAMMYCLEAGIDIPNDVGIAGFSNLNILEGMPKRLATTDSKRFITGLKAAEFIVAQLDNTDAKPGGIIEIESELVVGDSLRNG